MEILRALSKLVWKRLQYRWLTIRIAILTWLALFLLACSNPQKATKPLSSAQTSISAAASISDRIDAKAVLLQKSL